MKLHLSQDTQSVVFAKSKFQTYESYSNSAVGSTHVNKMNLSMIWTLLCPLVFYQ